MIRGPIKLRSKNHSQKSKGPIKKIEPIRYEGCPQTLKEKDIQTQIKIDCVWTHQDEQKDRYLPNLSLSFKDQYHFYNNRTRIRDSQYDVSSQAQDFYFQRCQQTIDHKNNSYGDPQFSNIVITKSYPQEYLSIIPYGFDTNKSRIIIGSRPISKQIDTKYQQLLNIQGRPQIEPQRGIKVTTKRFVH